MKNRLKSWLILSAGVVCLGIVGCGGSGNTPSNPVPPAIHNEWTWRSGSNVVYQNGVYGTKGVAAASNTPGARVYAVTWTDTQGNFWLFGGYSITSVAGVPGDLNDLWEYSSTTNEWTWMGGSNQTEQAGIYGTQGISSANNVPGARWQAVSWTDTSGNFWLLGGIGIDSTGTRGQLNDLWKYNPDMNEWTWMSGSNTVAVTGQAGVYGTKGIPAPGNTPAARVDANSWADASGNLWLFGGSGRDATGTLGILNDLWKYNPDMNEWTWVSGSNLGNANPVYGTQGVAAPGNVPGARFNAVTWADASGNLWLFGGEGNDVNVFADCPGGNCNLNDLWKYNPATNEWTWIGGSNMANQLGVYGTQGVEASSNIPPPRWGAVSWEDASGNFWLFGGDAGPGNDFNDLWKYSPAKNEWTWMSGSNQPAQLGTYGTQGIPAPANVPGARAAAVGWIDKSGSLWLFGGENYDSVAGGGKFNDLWEYQP